jgi:hypothetical protein
LTGSEQPSPTFDGLTGDPSGESDKVDQAKAALESQLQAEKDGRMEERFMWIVIVVILIDVLWFRNAPNAVVPIVVLLLESVILFVLAKRMGIDEMVLLFEKMIQSVGQRGQ